MDQEALFRAFQQDFVGLRQPAPIVGVDGVVRFATRTYLDSAATCLMPRPVLQAIQKYFETACANSHTVASSQGRDTTAAMQRAHALVGELVEYDPSIDCVILVGSGATAATNLLASALFRKSATRPLVGTALTGSSATGQFSSAVATPPPMDTARQPLARPLAVVSEMEHHSNLLPWVRAAGQENVRTVPCKPDGTLDLQKLQELLQQEGSRVRVIAVTAVSNVTGIINPIYEIAKLAHDHGAEIAVDAAQAGAHIPISMHLGEKTGYGLDYVVMSGHKLYAPGSPGILVGKKAPFADCGWEVGAVGGGTVQYVGDNGDVLFKEDVVERQEAGTPNIPGTIALGVAAGFLRAIGMNTIREHERVLTDQLIKSLSQIPTVNVYGSHDASARSGVVSFNIGTMHHSLVAAVLNDMFAIAVRNDCFCAQPYVREQLNAACDTQGFCVPPSVRGMVRASLGIYTTPTDIQHLAAAVAWIASNQQMLEQLYVMGSDNEYHHRVFNPPPQFDVEQQVKQYNGIVPAGQARAAGQTAAPVSISPAWGILAGLAIGAFLFWMFGGESAPMHYRERPGTRDTVEP